MVLAEVSNTIDYQFDTPASAAKRRGACRRKTPGSNTIDYQFDTPASKRRKAGRRKTPGSRQSKRKSKAIQNDINSENVSPIKEASEAGGTAATTTTVTSQTETPKPEEADYVELIEQKLRKSEEEANGYKELLTHICNIIRQSEPVDSPALEDSEVISPVAVVNQLKRLLFISSRNSPEVSDPSLCFMDDSGKDISNIDHEPKSEGDQPDPSFIETPLDSTEPIDNVSDKPIEISNELLATTPYGSKKSISTGRTGVEKKDSTDDSSTMNMSPDSPKVKKRGRRRTMAVVRGQLLLSAQDEQESEGEKDETEMSASLTMMENESGDASYVPSTTHGGLSDKPATRDRIVIRSSTEEDSMSTDAKESQAVDATNELSAAATMSSLQTMGNASSDESYAISTTRSGLPDTSAARDIIVIGSATEEKSTSIDEKDSHAMDTASEVSSAFTMSTIPTMGNASSDETYVPSTGGFSDTPAARCRIVIKSATEEKSMSTERKDSQTMDVTTELPTTATIFSEEAFQPEKNELKEFTAHSSDESSQKQDVNENSANDNVASRPTRKKHPRKSGRRKTLALHKGTLLLSHESPNPLSPVTPNADKSVLDSSLNKENKKKSVSFPGIEVKSSRNVLVHEDVASSDEKLDTPAGADVTGSTKRSSSALRRSLRNSVMPEKFREEGILLLGYHPTPRTPGSELATKSTKRSDTDVRSCVESSSTSDLHATPKGAVDKRMASDNKSNENGTVSANHANEKDKNIGTAVTSEQVSLNSITTKSGGLPPLPSTMSRTRQPPSTTKIDSCPPKSRKKRRSSVGLHFNKGGLLTSTEIDGVMQETMSLASRKRSRRGKVNAPEQKNKDWKPSTSDSNSESSNMIAEEREEILSSTQGDKCESESDFSAQLLGTESSREDTETTNNQTALSADYTENTSIRSKTAEMQFNGKMSMEEKEEPKALPDISVSEISRCMGTLFPEQDTFSKPCLSARIFACYALAAEKTSDSPAKAGTRTRRNRSCRHVEQILPLLTCMVQAELSSIGKYDAPKFASKVIKRVQFCSIDGSSTRPPVDSVVGSNIPLEENIRDLHGAVREAHALCKLKEVKLGGDVKGDAQRQLKSLISFLQDFEESLGTHLVEACASSMPQFWPCQRFVKASRLYRMDLVCILTSLAESQQIGFDGNSLILEQRLADCVGRSIRYYLRKFFNPPPLPLTTDEEVDTSVRSRVHECLELAVPDDDSRDTAAADGSVSSVFSIALRHIYNHIGAELLSSEDGSINTQMAFCTSGATARGLGTKKNPIILSEADVEEVLSDIYNAHAFLAAARSCKFLMDLLQWPGVKEEVQLVGGWSNVEDFSRMIQEFDLKRACEDDAYFVLLRNIGLFHNKIINYWAATEPLVASCEESLRELWKKFRCGTNSKSVLQRNPSIKTLAAALREGNEFILPALSEPSKDE